LADDRQAGALAVTGAPVVVVLGAAGLIGGAVAEDLRRSGVPLIALARRFTNAQRAALGEAAREAPFASFDPARLAEALASADIVVNCVGVLQDGPRGRAYDAHVRFVATLIAALQARPKPALLLHLSIPGAPQDDATPFSRSKRRAEALIAGSGLAHVILRPGFVIAPAAFGGSALVRALAALPLRLEPAIGQRPLATTDVSDLCATVRRAAELWGAGWPHEGAVVWEVMEPRPSTVAGVVEAFRARFGGPEPWLTLPAWLLRAGAWAGDVAGWLGWSAPVRSTALAELRRGVVGAPAAWTAATGLNPANLDDALARFPATVQEGWFGRLYLAKPLVLATLAGFWLVSGAIAVGPGEHSAEALLAAHGVPVASAPALTWTTALADIVLGAAIALRRTCRAALTVSLALTLAYLAAATILAPALWTDPLGPLVKDAPALVLTLVALAILQER
jgi:uncharacterized protein YbjT (DUF2867 family)